MAKTPSDEPPRLGLRRRIRYHFDNLLARGTWAALLWLGAITLAAVLLSATLLAIFQVTFTGNQDAPFMEDFWQTLLRVLDPGTMAGDVGWGRRVLALAVTVFGILVAGTLIGVIAAGVEDRVESMRRGRSVVIESDHIVVLGDSERLPVLLHQLAIANSRRAGSTFVVLADRDPAELHEEVRGLAGERLPVRLVFRSGDPTRGGDLKMARLQTARTVIVMGEDGGDDARAIKTVMAVGAELGSFDRLPVIVELSDPALGEGLILAWGPNVHSIAPQQAITRTASFALRDRGLGQIVTQLTDLEGSDLHVLAEPGVAGKPFSEIVRRYAKARPIGRMLADGQVQLNPGREVRFEAEDRLIVIADDGGPLSMSARSSGTIGSRPQVALSSIDDTAEEDRLQVVGWNHLGAAMLQDWAGFVRPGSSVEILYDPRLLEPNEVNAPESSDSVRIRLTPTTSFPVLPAALSSDVTTVLLLGYTGQLSDDKADSRTLLELAALRRHFGIQSGALPRVITHLVDASNVPLSGSHGRDDFVVSDAIGSQLIAQFAEQPERRPVLLELYRPGGPEFRLVPVAKLGLAGEWDAGDILDALYDSGWLAIGWRRRNDGELVMNPHESTHVELAPDDEIVLIA